MNSDLWGIELNRAIARARNWTVQRKDWETEQEARIYRNQCLWEFYDEDGDYAGIVLAENEDVAWVEAWRHDGDGLTALPDWAYNADVGVELCEDIISAVEGEFQLIYANQQWAARFVCPPETCVLSSAGSCLAEAVARLLLQYYLMRSVDDVS